MPPGPERLSWLINTCLCGVKTTPEDVENMQMDIPARIRLAILKASGLLEEKVERETPETQDFREDTPFSTTKEKSSGMETEDMIQWLHDQGYGYKELYGLLMGEIERLAEGFERKKEKEENADSKKKSSNPSFGSKRDRAKELGWR